MWNSKFVWSSLLAPQINLITLFCNKTKQCIFVACVTPYFSTIQISAVILGLPKNRAIGFWYIMRQSITKKTCLQLLIHHLSPEKVHLSLYHNIINLNHQQIKYTWTLVRFTDVINIHDKLFWFQNGTLWDTIWYI